MRVLADEGVERKGASGILNPAYLCYSPFFPSFLSTRLLCHFNQIVSPFYGILVKTVSPVVFDVCLFQIESAAADEHVNHSQ